LHAQNFVLDVSPTVHFVLLETVLGSAGIFSAKLPCHMAALGTWGEKLFAEINRKPA
jgi:hypothetical protein